MTGLHVVGDAVRVALELDRFDARIRVRNEDMEAAITVRDEQTIPIVPVENRVWIAEAWNCALYFPGREVQYVDGLVGLRRGEQATPFEIDGHGVDVGTHRNLR